MLTGAAVAGALPRRGAVVGIGLLDGEGNLAEGGDRNDMERRARQEGGEWSVAAIVIVIVLNICTSCSLPERFDSPGCVLRTVWAWS
ncbi:MAG: hypothetical protein CMJ49_06180 [Planctomycetaceae bacterium]|nr:hypothetical protein [Planctomycetaceae bacterium]